MNSIQVCSKARILLLKINTSSETSICNKESIIIHRILELKIHTDYLL